MLSRLMGSSGLVARTALLATAALTVSCADHGVIAPEGQRPSLALTAPTLDTVTVMQRVTPIAQDITVGAWIGRGGGSLAIPEAGLRVVVPAGTVQRRTYFTVTAYAGNLVSYEFGPHGTTFLVPVQMQQDTRGLSFWDPRTRSVITQVNAAYFPNVSDINLQTGTASVSEILPAELDFFGSRIRWNVGHFSGYLLASGRTHP